MSSFCRCCVDPAPASEPFVKGSTEGAALLTGEAARTRLFELLPTCQRTAVCFILLTSLSLNITVLMPGVPFLILEVQPPLDEFLQPGNYGLGATLNLLKKGHLWSLYILIILFSICFPLAKLAAVVFLLAKKLTSETRDCAFNWLGHLGRWSLLDIYVAMLLIMIAWHQGIDVNIGPINLINDNIGTQPCWGLYLFHGAIICSMAAVTWLQELNAGVSLKPPPPLPEGLPRRPLILDAGVRGVVAVLLCVITFVLHVLSLSLPIFDIAGVHACTNGDDPSTCTEIPLRPIEHRLGSSVYETAPLFAVDMTTFLMLTPGLTMLFCILVLLVPVNPARWCHTTIRYLSEWSMFDVYVFALIIYLSSANRIIQLHLKPATYCMFVYIPFMFAAVIVAEGAVRQAVDTRFAAASRAVAPPSIASKV